MYNVLIQECDIDVLIQECDIDELSSECRAIWQSLADKLSTCGASVSDTSLPHFKYGVPCYNILCSSEVASNMAKYSGTVFG